ncbi:hypothetical protein VP1G_01342 [Cytospora mali]|uniref:Uncharacterized protein n=1 Tax=Cytospora mali TaxID=578113 RepID=A0A194UR22_CYTMA|nr:hypothetical protein VP1G_01342 [Valsa mali var. pyri (nom. inval.)]
MMGLRSYKTKSMVNSEKGVDDSKQSSSCLPLQPFSLIRWVWRERRQKRDHQKIEEIRQKIDKDRKDVQHSLDDWELHRTTWRRRARAWKNGEDISVKECVAGRFTYDTAYRYMVTLVGPISGKKVVIVDFRTPEGREKALKWYESRYRTCVRNGKRFLDSYDVWEEEYEDYMDTLEKSWDRADEASLRRTLLRGVPQVYWVVATAKRLPN